MAVRAIQFAILFSTDVYFSLYCTTSFLFMFRSIISMVPKSYVSLYEFEETTFLIT